MPYITYSTYCKSVYFMIIWLADLLIMLFISPAMFWLTGIAMVISRIMRSRFIINSFSFMNVSVVFVAAERVALSFGIYLPCSKKKEIDNED